MAELTDWSWDGYLDSQGVSGRMWGLSLFLIAVVTYIFLYWFHKPKADSGSDAHMVTTGNGP